VAISLLNVLLGSMPHRAPLLDSRVRGNDGLVLRDSCLRRNDGFSYFLFAESLLLVLLLVLEFG
jgi:hypothetical protein